jgi:hypothetical protein
VYVFECVTLCLRRWKRKRERERGVEKIFFLN